MKAVTNKPVSLFVGITLVMIPLLSACSSHGRAVRKLDHPLDSKKVSKLAETAAQNNRSNDVVVPPADLTAAEYERLGDIYLSKGDPINTFTHYEKSLQKDPHNMRIHYKKGLLFLIEGMYTDAISSLEQVLETEPDNALAHKGLGQALYQLKQHDKAKEHLQKAAQLDGSLWNAHNLLGVMYDRENNHRLAIDEYEKALAIKKDSGIVYNNRGLSYSMVGDYQKAIDSFNCAIRTGFTENKVFNNLGFALFMAGNKREAFEAFKKGGDEAQAFNNLGSMYLVAGDHEKAQKCFEDAIVLKPAFYETANENLKKCSIRNLDDLTFLPEKKMGGDSAQRAMRAEDAINRPVGGRQDTQNYIVKEGDTAFSIAKHHNMNLSDFLNMNNIDVSGNVYADSTVLVRPR